MSETNQVRYEPDADRGQILIYEEPLDTRHGPTVEQAIQFQHGPIDENGINGVTNEDVLLLVAIRLRNLNTKFPCRENSLAITKIEEALHWLEHRTKVRQGRRGQEPRARELMRF